MEGPIGRDFRASKITDNSIASVSNKKKKKKILARDLLFADTRQSLANFFYFFIVNRFPVWRETRVVGYKNSKWTSYRYGRVCLCLCGSRGIDSVWTLSTLESRNGTDSQRKTKHGRKRFTLQTCPALPSPFFFFLFLIWQTKRRQRNWTPSPEKNKTKWLNFPPDQPAVYNLSVEGSKKK